MPEICENAEETAGEIPMKLKCVDCGREVDVATGTVILGVDILECKECQSRTGFSGHQIQTVDFCHPPCGTRPKAKPYTYAWDVTNHYRALEKSHNVAMWYYLEDVAYHVPINKYELWSPERKKKSRWRPFVPDSLFFKTEADGVVRASSLVIKNATINQLAEVSDMLHSSKKATTFISTKKNPVEIVDCVQIIKGRLRKTKMPRVFWHDVIITNMLEWYDAPFYAKETPMWLDGPITIEDQYDESRIVNFPMMTGHIDILGGDIEKIFIYDYKPKETGMDKGRSWVYYAPQLCAYAVMLLERVPDLRQLLKEEIMTLELGIFNELKLVTFELSVIHELQAFFGAGITKGYVSRPIHVR